MAKRSRTPANANNVAFELHTLGWEAFQNLCGHVAREVLGQTVTAFSPSHDAGQDGAFEGEWKPRQNETYTGRFVIQCKFTVRRDSHLTLANLQDELAKARKLGERGLVQTYLLITNAKVSGEAYIAIRRAFTEIPAIKSFEVYGSEWLSQQILSSKRLRAYVPRIYGLGDLTQILDERAYRQADEILLTWKDNLSKFVPTDAHHKSVNALLEDGFVLLLGDPMAGKSTIAAALALASADQWGCLPVFISSPEDFKSHWNPDEPKQFFWVDDAFGQTQLESSLAQGWNRAFPHVAAALRSGSRILFTSRTYIYHAAQRELKESAFPIIKNSRVIIEVDKLTVPEKERILYNHLRLGQQPPNFRTSIKPFLPQIAANPKFFPEVAKRLGDPFFTKNLIVHEASLKRFVEEPKEFLYDVIAQLDRKNFSALALLFMRAGRITIPPRFEPKEIDSMSLLGADLSDVIEALTSLGGSLVAIASESGDRFWKFRHPSIRDAMAMHVASRPELIEIYLAGVKTTELLREVVVGDIDIPGVKVHIPKNCFSAVIMLVKNIPLDDWSVVYNYLSVLATRCSLSFLVEWHDQCVDDFRRLSRRVSVGHYNLCLLYARLRSAKVLSETDRLVFIESATRHLTSTADPTLLDPSLNGLMTVAEYSAVA